MFLKFRIIPIGFCLAALFLLVVLLLGCCWNVLVSTQTRRQLLIICRVTDLLKRLEKGLKGPQRTYWQAIIGEAPISWHRTIVFERLES
jgi:hypothetical protein